jgi:hypothetical protein
MMVDAMQSNRARAWAAAQLSTIAGDLLGAVTDRLVKYQVTGTTAEPEVHVLPFGVGATPTDR